MDSNAIIASLSEGAEQAVVKQIGSRQPIVPIQAIKEVRVRHSADEVRAFMERIDARIGLASSEQTAAGLRQMGPTLKPKRVLHVEDSRIAGSALREGVPVMTRDKKFTGFLNAIGQAVESY